MKAVQLTVDELIAMLTNLRSAHGNVPVEVYDAVTWESLPFLSVEFSAAPRSVLIVASDEH